MKIRRLAEAKMKVRHWLRAAILSGNAEQAAEARREAQAARDIEW
jgi:hypothetical protein